MRKIKLKRKTVKRDNKRRPINVLASVITTISLYLGLWSIFCSIRQDYTMAAYLILGAIVFDMTDGTVARITKSISDFGKELDSLSDLVSFGVAPAVLIYHAYMYEEQLPPTAPARFGSVMAIGFVICAALRLARYNVFQSAHRESFTGLPTPAAGGTIAAFVLFMNCYELHVAFYVLTPLTIFLAYLMVSTVRYPKDRLKKVFLLAPRNAFRMLALSVIVIAVFHYAITHSPAIVLFPLAMTYVMFGVGDELLLLVRHKSRSGIIPDQQKNVPQAPGPLELASSSGPAAANKDDLR